MIGQNSFGYSVFGDLSELFLMLNSASRIAPLCRTLNLTVFAYFTKQHLSWAHGSIHGFPLPHVICTTTLKSKLVWEYVTGSLNDFYGQKEIGTQFSQALVQDYTKLALMTVRITRFA